MSSLASNDFQRIFESAPGLFLVLLPDDQFTIVAASDAYLRATLTTRKEVIGRGLFDVFPDNPDDLAVHATSNLRASLERVIATKQADTMRIQKYDIPDRTSDAKGFVERYWSPVNAPVMSDSGELRFIVHRVEDATELVRSQMNLRATEILESIPEGFFAVDRNWRFRYVNREATLILGRDDLIGLTLWDAYPGVSGTEFGLAYRESMEARRAATLTAYYPDHDRWYEVHVYPAIDGLSVYFRNVTAQTRIEEERERLVVESDKQRRIYEAALSNTPDLVYVFDLDHRFIYANEALLKMWGRSLEDSLGRTCLELGYEPWHAAMHDREIEQVRATRQAIRGEVPFTGTEGRRMYDYIFVPVVGPDGEVVAVAGTTRDVTERQQAEQAIREQAQRLMQSDAAKDEFLATLSHELRNPLAPLRNAIHVLRNRPEPSAIGSAAAVKLFEIMDRQVNHLVRLVDDLLEMSRITRGALTLRKEQVDVVTIVRNAVETSEPLMRAAGHRLSVSVADDASDQKLLVQGDPVRLTQIVANLLDNATKYTDDGGAITIDVRKLENDCVEVAVGDNGCGIAAEELPRMFEMFSRGEHANRRGQGGLGIGLALSRRLAAMHGAELNAYSGGVGKGSRFILKIALAPDGAGLPAVPQVDHPLHDKKVLIVDDNVDAAASLGELLRMLGVDVRIASNGPDALDILNAYEPTTVLLDIGMPGMDGYEVARRIRSRVARRRPSIVALTGWGQEEDRRRAREAGFDHHLVKPAGIDALQRLLAHGESAQAVDA